jgi:hypothetical protein
MFTKFFWLPVVFCISVTAVSEAPAADNNPGETLGNALGFASTAYLEECYFSLVDAETVRGTGASSIVKHHLEVQTRLLEGLVARWEAIRTADLGRDLDKLGSQSKEIAAALLAQNQALNEYLADESQNLEPVRAKRAVSRKLLIALSTKNDIKGLP